MIDKDAIKVISYVLSKEREKRIIAKHCEDIEQGFDNPMSIEEKMRNVYHADIENGLDD